MRALREANKASGSTSEAKFSFTNLNMLSYLGYYFLFKYAFLFSYLKHVYQLGLPGVR